VIFANWSFALGWSDQSLAELWQNGLEHLLAARLCPQHSARLFHFAPFLAIAVPTAREKMALNLLPGWPCPITCEKVKLWPQVQDDLVNSETRGIKQAQCLSLHGIG